MCQCPARYARNVKLVSQKNSRQRTMHVTSYKQMCPKQRSNLTTLLDLCVRNMSILKFHVRLNRKFSSMWLTKSEGLYTQLTGSLSLSSRLVNTAVTFTICSRFRILVLVLQSIPEHISSKNKLTEPSTKTRDVYTSESLESVEQEESSQSE